MKIAAIKFTSSRCRVPSGNSEAVACDLTEQARKLTSSTASNESVARSEQTEHPIVRPAYALQIRAGSKPSKPLRKSHQQLPSRPARFCRAAPPTPPCPLFAFRCSGGLVRLYLAAE